MLTGLHGFHVMVGVTYIIICVNRYLNKHYTPSHHIGFLLGSNMNDIMIQAQNKNISSILIEVHENSSLYPTNPLLFQTLLLSSKLSLFFIHLS